MRENCIYLNGMGNMVMSMGVDIGMLRMRIGIFMGSTEGVWMENTLDIGTEHVELPAGKVVRLTEANLAMDTIGRLFATMAIHALGVRVLLRRSLRM